MKKLIYLVVAALMFASCDDFLATENLTQKNSKNFPVNETDATQMITAIYATMNIAVQKGVNKTYFYIAQVASDDCYGGGGENDKDAQASDHIMYNGASLFADFWSARYQGINRANMALANLNNVANEKVRNQKKGEALFLRSYFYFELTQMFENVPLISIAPENVAAAQTAPVQMPADSIYAHIASDLKQAVEIMPDSKWNEVESGTATRWAAEALLARVYLFYTGFYQKDALPLTDGTKLDKNYVITKLNDCITNSGHSLAPDFRSLWPYTNSVTKKNSTYQADAPTWLKDGENPEQVFALKFCYQSAWVGDKLGFSNQYALYFGIRDQSTDYGLNGTYPIGQGWGQGPVAANLWNDWKTEEPNDTIRRKGSIYQVKDNFQYGRDAQMEETGLWQSKIVATRAIVGDKDYPSFCSTSDYYGDGTSMGHFQVSSAQDLTLIRFADVLLMQSELTGTADGMNKVRARVHLPSVSYSLDALKKERRFELAFEGLRWGDIRRWHDAETALAKQVGQSIWNKGQATTMKDQGAGYVARYKATRGFFPIPKTEIDLSNGALKQNPGWDASANYSSWNN